MAEAGTPTGDSDPNDPEAARAKLLAQLAQQKDNAPGGAPADTSSPTSTPDPSSTLAPSAPPATAPATSAPALAAPPINDVAPNPLIGGPAANSPLSQNDALSALLERRNDGDNAPGPAPVTPSAFQQFLQKARGGFTAGGVGPNAAGFVGLNNAGFNGAAQSPDAAARNAATAPAPVIPSGSPAGTLGPVPPVPSSVPTRPVNDVAPSPIGATTPSASGGTGAPVPTSVPTPSSVIRDIVDRGAAPGGAAPGASVPAPVAGGLPKGVPNGATWDNTRGLYTIPGSAVGWTKSGFPINLNGVQQTPVPDVPLTPQQQAMGDRQGGIPSSVPGGAGGVPSSVPGGAGAPANTVSQLQQAVTEVNSLAGSLRGASPDVVAMFTNQAQAILQMIDQQEAQMRADAAKDGTQIDASTQYTLDQLKKTLDENITKTGEDLNSRGLYSSGILLDLEQKLRSGNMSEQAKILGSRLDAIRQGLQTNLQSLQTNRIKTVSDFGMAGAKAGFDQAQSGEAQRQALIGKVFDAKSADSRQAQQEAFTANQQTQALQAAMQQKQAEIAAAAREGDLNRANQAQIELTKLQAAASQSAASEAAANQRAAAAEAGANSRNAATIGAENQRASNANGATTQAAYNTYVQKGFQYADEAIADVNANAGPLQAAGVNIQALIQLIQSTMPATPSQTDKRFATPGL